MANIDAPRGFVPIGHMTGGQIRARSYLVNEDTDTLYKGDVVAMGNNGKIDRAAADQIICGVVAEYCATAEGVSIMIYDDPNILYEVQGYTGVAFTAGAVGEQADIVATAGSDTTKLSLEELNEGGLLAPGQFIIIGKVDRPDNAWGEHVKLIAKPYRHFYAFNPTS